ncbi:MAG: YjbQ family protein [Spirochaetales bacterium]|nr:YjbQ family protein [Spirochaetales bacterium]
MKFFSHQLRTGKKTEFINITSEVRKCVTDSGINEGLCIVYIPHTTAAVTINEAADPSVVVDILESMNKLVPFQDNYRHMEGNSHAHIKSSLFGITTQIPVKDNHLTLGTWQGIFFCEFDGPRNRTYIVQIIGKRE